MLGPFIGLVLVIVMFSIKPDVRAVFLTTDNFGLVAMQTVIVALGALGMTVVIISAGIDLSAGSVIALSSVAAALFIRAGDNPIFAIISALVVGGLTGVVNGALITALDVTPFIVTLGMMGIARGIAKWLAQEQTVNAPNTWLNGIALPNLYVLGVPVSPGVWITLALAVAMVLVLRYTRFGRHVFAIGSNEKAARLCGLRVDLTKIAIYGLSGVFLGLAGLVQFARLGQGDPTVAVGAELDIIAACVIGGASLNGGEGSILGSILGALIMAFLRNGSVQMGWSTYVQDIIIGAVIIAAVAVDRLRHRQPRKVAAPKPRSPGQAG
jgi:ribose transport system permease protein